MGFHRRVAGGRGKVMGTSAPYRSISRTMLSHPDKALWDNR